MTIKDPERLAVGEGLGYRDQETGHPNPAARQQKRTLKHEVSNLCEIRDRQANPRVCRGDKPRRGHLHGVLEALTTLHRSHRSMESLLQTAARMMVDVLDLEHCSIAWLDQDAAGVRIWTSHTREGGEIHPGRVLEALSGLVKRQPPSGEQDHPRAVATLQSLYDANQGREIISPLRIDKQIVGYICGFKPGASIKRIPDKETSLFAALSRHVSAAIEAQRTREMLDSPYVALALTPLERECLAGLTARERPFLAPDVEPERLVRKIARRFFADLHRAGFEIKQILWVATEILDSLLVIQHKTKSGSSQ